MKFDTPLLTGVLKQRYKRFLVDIETETGETITVHCANPGSMLGLTSPGNKVCYSDSKNPKRKLPMSLEMIKTNGAWVGINTHLANRLAEEAIINGTISKLQAYSSIRREVKYGQNSRIDLLLEHPERRPCYVEVKSVTLSRGNQLAEFPDSVTTRGAKHLGELENQVNNGARAVQLFVIQRSDCNQFSLAIDIDPVYSRALQQAKESGVEILAYGCDICPTQITINRQIECHINQHITS